MPEYIEAGDCDLHKEYVNLFGKKVQIIEKQGNKVRVEVRATQSEIYIPKSYRLFEIEKPADDEKQEEIVVSAKDVIEKSAQKEVPKVGKQPKEKSVQAVEEKKVAKKTTKETKKGEKKMKNGTIKQLVWDMLKRGACTRDDLAKAAIAKEMTDSREVSKVKNYISVVLHQLKKKEGVNIVTLKPGTYKIEE